MRFADALLRRGHLSDAALFDAWHSGDRPAHLDSCPQCLHRIVDLTRCLDEVRRAGIEEADAVFSPERLAAQHAQIMRRLEHLDRPARLIAFPGTHPASHDTLGLRHWRGFVAAAAAAGLLLGVAADRITVEIGQRAQRAEAMAKVALQPEPVQAAIHQALTSDELAALEAPMEPSLSSLAALDDVTPHVKPTLVSLNSGQ